MQWKSRFCWNWAIHVCCRTVCGGADKSYLKSFQAGVHAVGVSGSLIALSLQALVLLHLLIVVALQALELSGERVLGGPQPLLQLFTAALGFRLKMHEI